MADPTRPWRRTRKTDLRLLNRNAQKHDVRAAGELILRRLRAGDFLKAACASAGVPYSTAKRWLRLGRNGVGSTWRSYICREEHVWFYEEVERTLAVVEGNAVDAWTEVIKQGNWHAAAEFLARRFPRRWARSKRRAAPSRSAVQTELQLVWDDDDQGEKGQPDGSAALDEEP